MLRNILTVSLRNISRQKGFAFINVFGLAIGLASFVLIAMFVQHELSVDRHLIDGDRIYRVDLDASVNGQDILTSSSPAVMAGVFVDVFPEVEAGLRINDWSSALLSYEDRSYYEDNYFEADSTVFEFFNIELVEGDPAGALSRPGTIVLAEEAAARLFKGESPVGKSVVVDNGNELEVTGVFALPSERTHFRPAVIASFLSNSQSDSPIWLNNSFATYIRLIPGADPRALEAKFPDFQVEHLGPQVQQFLGQSLEDARTSGLKYDWVLQSMPEIYLYGQADDGFGVEGDVRYVYILGVIALFVLGIACVNFMNLATARAGGRAREVGLRKVLGSDRASLIRQFLSESTVMAGIAMILAIGVALSATPVFESLAGVDLVFRPWLIALVVGVTVLTGLLAGSYPAIYLSSFRPAVVLRGTFNSGGKGRLLRSGLVVFQFAISITLLVGTMVVMNQLDYLQNRELGFERDRVLFLPIETRDALDSFPTLREELMRNPDILNAASGNALPGPGHIHNNTVFRAEGTGNEENFIAAFANVSDDYVETLGLTMAAGRDFQPGFEGDGENYVINEEAAKEMGFTAKEAVGRRLVHIAGGADDEDVTGTIVGVMKNAHYESLHTPVRPIVLGHRDWWQRYAVIQARPESMSRTLGFLEERWAEYQPGYPFRYTFMDDDVDRFYEQERRLGTIYSVFTTLAIVIACLGLFGLASFVTARRRKEIGVRKVLGASVPGIVTLLSREFTALVVVSCLIAFPISWFAMSRWLEDFAYSAPIGWGVFAVAGAAALSIAWLTVSWQSIRAATANPVDALRSE